MSLWQPDRRLNVQVDRASRRLSTTKRRDRLSRRRFGLAVALLEERILLSTPTLTTLGLSSSSLTYGQSELLTATVTTDPAGGTTPTGGVVTFMEGGTTLGTGNLSAGTAALNTTKLPAGTDPVSAVYGGTSTFAGSSSATGTAIIETIAGGGDPADRQAVYTNLAHPAAVAVDSAGDLFIADTYNNVIREINGSTGAITIVAGNGTAGYGGDGGLATAAELRGPQGIAVDSAGDLYIADTGNDLIREVNATTKKISTVAGTYNSSATSTYSRGGYSGDGGPATAAKMNQPEGIFVAGGSLYIADTYNNLIREVDLSTGIITTVAGTYNDGDGGYSGDGGPATSAELDGPSGVAVDSSGNLYIADTYNGVIREVNAGTQDISTVAGSYVGDFSGGYSGDGGPATAALLDFPEGVAVNSSGDIYIADTFNSAIREVNASTGDISTVAGDGGSGYLGDGGPATAAELADPAGLALDSAGDIFIADSGNETIREVAATSGVINTVAGGLGFGYSGDGGPASSAELAGPTSVAVDGSGNVYIADTSNNVVREVNSTTGQITTVAGGGQPVYQPISDTADPAMDSAGDLFIANVMTNEVEEVHAGTGEITVVAGNGTAGYSGDGGQATAAELNEPSGLAVNSAGDLFIADSQNNVIREVNLHTGIITTFAGNFADGGDFSGDGGLATAAGLNDPIGIALDSSGNLYIADTGNNVIREVDAATNDISTVAGDNAAGPGYRGDGGLATAAQLRGPQGVALDSAGDLYIADTDNDLIREVNATTKKISTVAGTYNSSATSTYSRGGYSGDGGPATSAALNLPEGIFVSGGSLYIADSLNDAVREVNLNTGVINTVAGNGSVGYGGDGGQATAAQLSFPEGVVVGGAGNLFIADSGNSVIREVDATSHVITTIVGGDGGLVYSNDDGLPTDATLANPDGIAVDSQGDIFIADEYFNAVREINASTGLMTTIAGNGNYGYSGDGGQATDAELGDPAGLAIEGNNLFIADSGNNVIREVNLTTGVITTVAGNGTYGSSGDGGLATNAELSNPTGVAVDSSGNIFIADVYDNEVREVSATTHDISTIAGDGTYGYSGDGGQASDAQLADPSGVALNGSGDLFIADTDNDVIRELNLTTNVITTVAGIGDDNNFSGDGGSPTAATLDGPSDVAVDSAGNVYIADTFNNVIREFSTTGGGQTITVAKAVLTVTADNATKTYGTTPTLGGTAFTETGLVTANGDTLSSVTLTSAGTARSATVGTDPIVPSAAVGSGLSNYTIVYDNGTLNVTTAALTITANSTSKTYGDTSTLAGTAFTETGLVTANGDTLTSVTLASDGTPAAAAVGTYPIVPSAAIGTGLSNYTITYDNGTLTVSPATLTVTITANDLSKVYGTTATLGGTAFTATGLSAGDSVTSVTLTSAGAARSAAVGTYPIVPSAAAGSGLSNYTIVYDNGTLTVTPAALTITANSTSKTEGNTLTLAGTAFTATGLVTANGDTLSSVTLTSAGTAAAAAVGSYSIVPSAAVGSGLSNYTIVYDNATLTVTPTPPPPSTPTQTVVIGEQPFLTRKLKHGKPVGKASLSGFTLTFGVPLNSAAASNAANYELDTVTIKKVRKKKVTVLHPIRNFTVSYLAANNALQLTFGGKETFPTGGQLTIVGGLTTAAGGTLTGNAVFTIAKGGKSISLPS